MVVRWGPAALMAARSRRAIDVEAFPRNRDAPLCMGAHLQPQLEASTSCCERPDTQISSTHL